MEKDLSDDRIIIEFFLLNAAYKKLKSETPGSKGIRMNGSESSEIRTLEVRDMNIFSNFFHREKNVRKKKFSS